MVARYNGYADAYQLGVLASQLGLKYNRALLDPETSGGWGVAVVQSLQQVGYGNIVRQPRELMPGKWGEALGFVTSEQTRPGMISAIQDFLRSVRDGRPTALMPSADVLRCWQDTILNEKGKPVAAPGLHDEDLILAGQALKKLTRRKVAPVVETPQRKPQTLADLLKKPSRGMDRLLIRLRYPTQ